MQRRKRPKHHRRRREARCIQIDSEELIDGRESCGTAGHGVIRGRETIRIFVPGRGAREQQLRRHGYQVHIPKAPGETRKSLWGTEDEDYDGADKGGAEMAEAVGDPG